MTTRKISFPVDALFRSAIADNDVHEVRRLLVAHRSEISLDSVNHVGLTPLHQAVLNNNLDCVKALLHCDADVSVADMHGFTPLHTASACGFVPVISLLLIFGANPFELTSEGDLPIDLAKDVSICRLLQEQMILMVHQRLFWKVWLERHVAKLLRFLLKVVVWVWKTLEVV
jgi:hypothetical protein